jgi:DNA-binding transcriptional regulator GbsR (MarR family)
MQIMNSLIEFFRHSGMPKSMATVLAYLIVCQPPRQTANQIEKALHLSKGSVNMALNGLTIASLVLAQKQKGQRSIFYELDEGAWERAIQQRLQAMHQAITITQDLLKLQPDNKRLQEMHDAYLAFAERLTLK